MEKGIAAKAFRKAAAGVLLGAAALGATGAHAQGYPYASPQAQLNASNCKVNYVNNETYLSRDTGLNQQQKQAYDEMYRSQFAACMQNSGVGYGGVPMTGYPVQQGYPVAGQVPNFETIVMGTAGVIAGAVVGAVAVRGVEDILQGGHRGGGGPRGHRR